MQQGYLRACARARHCPRSRDLRVRLADSPPPHREGFRGIRRARGRPDARTPQACGAGARFSGCEARCRPDGGYPQGQLDSVARARGRCRKAAGTWRFLPDDPYYSVRTTPADLMKLVQAFYKIDELVYFTMLDKFHIPVHKRMDKFSKGMKRQVFVALAFAIKPKYLLLDEAFDGLDPIARDLFKAEIKRLVKENNSTVIISSHSLKDLEGMCDSFAILNSNKIQATGSLEEACSDLHKYQIAFKDEKDIHLFPRIYKTIEKDGRVIRLISELTLQEIETKLKDMNPVFIDELPIIFEEVFSAIVKDGGNI